MSRILAIDSGLTVNKAVVFDTGGRQLAVARWVERDMDVLWQQTASAIRDVLEMSETDPAQILSIAATAHGDGLYLLDRKTNPLGPAILSLDRRATQITQDWQGSEL